jgi:hypothetical protein
MQSVQVRSAVLFSLVSSRWPGWQTVATTHEAAPTLFWNVVFEHALHAVAPLVSANVPAMQSVHALGFDAPTSADALPAGHVMHAVRPSSGWNCPAGHLVQCVSASLAWLALPNFPVLHATHAACPFDGWYWPSVQFLQAVELPPNARLAVPGAHGLHVKVHMVTYSLALVSHLRSASSSFFERVIFCFVAAPLAGALPGSQSETAVLTSQPSLLVATVPLVVRPAGHALHDASWLLLWSRYFPTAQLLHSVCAPATLSLPAAHALHCVCAAASWYRPVTHSSQDAFAVRSWNLPGGQARHAE